jgi:hypothetical protein
MSGNPDGPSPEQPLDGRCLCGAVRFRVSAPFASAGYCHCEHCRRRTGATHSANARVPRQGLEIVEGAEQLRSFQPEGGVAKHFCATCGGHLFSGDLLRDEQVAVRLGALDGDPGIRPEYRQFLDSAVAWEPIPDDGLARYPRSRRG